MQHALYKLADLAASSHYVVVVYHAIYTIGVRSVLSYTDMSVSLILAITQLVF